MKSEECQANGSLQTLTGQPIQQTRHLSWQKGGGRKKLLKTDKFQINSCIKPIAPLSMTTFHCTSFLHLVSALGIALLLHLTSVSLPPEKVGNVLKGE